ncbi:uncharacterized protein LOC110043843 [Orbicella faveolata]|uniref:uncharacterized protein LOC110043843 n=1 Tax=Orbicella faveolata TaxID=48498 RepID=UPI0009E4B61E|nr:uncharacterized protein LOC110043843 [Orbicella faveolata]
MGHSCVNVQQAFWQEPVITWIALVISTGRCKSAFHEFLSQILEKVADKVEVRGHKARQMLLPHCTWDKFGEILSENGARSLGMFDELMSFFCNDECVFVTQNAAIRYKGVSGFPPAVYRKI